jgi:hypothetical protein
MGIRSTQSIHLKHRSVGVLPTAAASTITSASKSNPSVDAFAGFFSLDKVPLLAKDFDALVSTPGWSYGMVTKLNELIRTRGTVSGNYWPAANVGTLELRSRRGTYRIDISSSTRESKLSGTDSYTNIAVELYKRDSRTKSGYRPRGGYEFSYRDDPTVTGVRARTNELSNKQDSAVLKAIALSLYNS